jgi:hypothetical protein
MTSKRTIAYKIGGDMVNKHGSPGRGPKKIVMGSAVVGALAALTVGLAISPADAGETPITCTNPVSGTSWQIRVDYDRSTVDSNPARISDATISWHDAADGGNYTLDRKSGELTVIIASATGGNFLWDRCKLGD